MKYIILLNLLLVKLISYSQEPTYIDKYIKAYQYICNDSSINKDHIYVSEEVIDFQIFTGFYKMDSISLQKINEVNKLKTNRITVDSLVRKALNKRPFITESVMFFSPVINNILEVNVYILTHYRKNKSRLYKEVTSTFHAIENFSYIFFFNSDGNIDNVIQCHMHIN